MKGTITRVRPYRPTIAVRVALHDPKGRVITMRLPARRRAEFEHSPAWCGMEGPDGPVVVPKGFVLAVDDRYNAHLFTEAAWKKLAVQA